MAYTAYISSVEKIFLGYYQRPADPGGLNYWANQIDQAGGSVEAVLTAFSNSPEAQGLYGPINSSTIASVVNQIYNVCFNRPADAAGLAFYVNGFNAGTFTAATIMWNIVVGAQGQDLVTLNNKLVASDLFTKTIDPGLDNINYQATYSGTTDAVYGRTFLAGVTSVLDSIPTPDETTKFIQDYIANPGDPILPTFALSSSGASVNEGNTTYFTLTTTKIPQGTTYDYTITGSVNSADVLGGQMSGTVTIGADGKGIIPVTLVADSNTEGAESLTMNVAGQSASVTVNDTSTAPIPTFNLTANVPSVDEGTAVFFTLATTNVPPGSEYSWTITGVDADDVVGGALSGTTVVDNDGNAVISVTLRADATTEGAESLTMNVAGQSASVTVNDTSTTPTAFLTPDMDVVDFSTSIEVDKVRGLQGDDGTLTPGDYIEGNNLTIFELIADGGPDGGVVATVKNVAEINVYSVSDTTIEAVDFHDIGAINVTGGDNGNWIGIEDLDTGVPISIYGVTGSISASYDVPGVDQVNVRVYNGEPDTSASALLDANGNLSLTMDDGGKGDAIFRGGDVELDTINVWGGDDTWSEVQLGRYYHRAEDVDVNEVNAEIGENSHFRFDVDATGDVNIGDASLIAGTGNYAELYYEVSTSADIDLGDIYMYAGYSSDLHVYVGMSDSDSYAYASVGNITIDSIDMTAGSSSDLEIYVGAFADGYYSADAHVSNIDIGDIDMAASWSSSLDLVVGAEAYSAYTYGYSYDADASVGNITLGEINMNAGSYSNLWLGVGAGAEGNSAYAHVWGDITIDNIGMAAGYSSSLYLGVGSYADGYWNADAEVGNITIGDIDMAASGYSTLDLFIGADANTYNTWWTYTGDAYASVGDITLGDISMNGSYSSSLDLYVGAYAEGSYSADAIAGNITIGDIDMIGGDYSSLDLYIGAAADANWWWTFTGSAYASVGDIIVGDINMDAGDYGYSSSLDLFIGAEANAYWAYAQAGNITVGDINMDAGDAIYSSLDLYIGAYASASTSAYAYVGNITVGDISMAVGDYSSADLFIGADADASWITDARAENITVGDIDVTIGSGRVISTTSIDRVGIEVNIGNSYANGGNFVSVGDVTLTAGDFADIDLEVWNYNDNNAALGDVTVGQITAHAGESADVSISVSNSLSASGTVGNLTVEGVDVRVEQDSAVTLNIYHYASTGDVGNLNVGDIKIVTGDNLHNLDVNITSSASDGNAGTMTVGDIDIAASATTTVDLSGFSNIYVTIDHMAWGSHDLLGAETIGDISLSVGDESSITLEIDQTGTATLVDDLTIGAVDLVAGDSSSVTANIYFTNYMDHGDLGDFSLDAFNVTMGDHSDLESQIYINDSKTNDGDLGNVSIGSVSLNVGATSWADFDVNIYLDDGDAGNLSFGDLTVVAGKNADVDVRPDVDVYGEIGNLSFGDLSFTLGENAYAELDPEIWVSEDIGNIRFGDITANLAKSASLSVGLDLSQSSDIGNITIGNIDIVMGENARVDDLNFTFDVTQDIGLMEVGNISIDAGLNSFLDASFTLSASDDIDGMTVGDLSITAAAGSLIPIDFEINASGDAGPMTVGDISITAEDGLVTTDIINGAYIAADLGKHVNGAELYLDYKLYGSGDANMTIGDISVDLDTLSKVEIEIDMTNSGDVIIGDLTVSGAVGTVNYDGTAADDSGFFHFGNAGTVDYINTNGSIIIGDVDYSGYIGPIDIDMSWTDVGAANIWGNGSVNTITGNGSANTIHAGSGNDIVNGGSGNDVLYGDGGNDTLNGDNGNDTIYGGANNDTIHGNAGNDTIWGGTGQDNMWGDAGTDTFGFQKGDSGTSTNIDTIRDWASNEYLKFGLANGSSTNYREGAAAADIAAFLEDAADALDSTVKYYVAQIGADTYVAVNYGSGEADLVVDLVGVNINQIDDGNILF